MRSHDNTRRQSRRRAKKLKDEDATKKTYHGPQLFIYGGILQVTQALGHGVLTDSFPKDFKSRD